MSSTNATALRCIRRRDALDHQYERMAFFGELCAEDGPDLVHYSSPAFMDFSARFHEKLLEEMQQADASLHSNTLGQSVPSGDTISFRETL